MWRTPVQLLEPTLGFQPPITSDPGYLMSSSGLKTHKIFKNVIRFFFMCVGLHVCMCTACVLGACRGQKRASRSPGTGVTDACEPPCGVQEIKPGSLEDQQVPSLQLHKIKFSKREKNFPGPRWWKENQLHEGVLYVYVCTAQTPHNACYKWVNVL